MLRRPNRRRTGLVSTTVILVLAVAAWLTAGPARFGGPNTYLITSGNSMEPRFHSGDLAVLRGQSTYHVGDIIGYRWTPQAIVLHRIVAQDGDHFLMKGDNNRWTDSTEPDPNQVVGKLWLHIPSAGMVLQKLRQPWILAILVLVIASTTLLGRRSERTRTGKRGRKMNDVGGWSGGAIGIRREDALSLTLIVALVSLAVTVLAFSRPLNRTGSNRVGYQQTGEFSYLASAPGSIYTDGRAGSGDPIYLQLVHEVDVNFDYHFISNAPHSIQGTYSFLVELGQDTGWQRTGELVPGTSFTGDRVTMSGQIPLSDLQTLAKQFSDQTGIQGKPFTVTVVPIVKTQGTLAGTDLTEEYSPRLVFNMDAHQLLLDRSADKGDPLSTTESGFITLPRTEPNSFSILGTHLPISAVRPLALLSLAISLGASVWLVLGMLAAGRSDESTQIEARYGSLLLNVLGTPVPTQEDCVVDLLRFDDLVKVAGQHGRMILHSNGGTDHQYLVKDGEIAYRYVPAPTAPIAELQERGV